MSQTGKIFSLIPKVMSEVGAITKGRTNTHQNYAFRGIEDMYNSIQPALIKYGVFCCPQVLDSRTSEHSKKDDRVSFRVMLKVAHRFYADDGSYIEVITMGEGVDSSDKASNKAMSAAMKYAFIELLSVPTKDIEDSDRETPEPGPTIKTLNPHAAKNMQPEPGDGVQPEIPACGCGAKLKFTQKKSGRYPDGCWYCPEFKNQSVKHDEPIQPAEYEQIKHEMLLYALDQQAGENGIGA